MQYLLTLLSQACCHQETYKTQYPNHLLSSPHSDIHLLAAAKYTDFFFFYDLLSSDLSPPPWALLPCPQEGNILPPTPWPPAALTCKCCLPNQELVRSYFGPVQPQPQLCLQTVAPHGASPFFRPASGWESALTLLSSPLIPPSVVKSCPNHQVLSGFLMYFFSEDDKTGLQKVYTKKRLNSERSPRSALIGNKKWFSATDVSLLF